jgi:hypothetical protein
MIITCIRDAPGSDLRRDADYVDRFIVILLSFFSGRCLRLGHDRFLSHVLIYNPEIIKQFDSIQSEIQGP